MAAGANQQLVANSMQTKGQSSVSAAPSQNSTTLKASNAEGDGNGTLDIDHEGAVEQVEDHDDQPAVRIAETVHKTRAE